MKILNKYWFTFLVLFLSGNMYISGQSNNQILNCDMIRLDSQSQIDEFNKRQIQNSIKTIKGSIYVNAKRIPKINFTDSLTLIDGSLILDSVSTNSIDYIKSFKHIEFLEITNSDNLNYLDLSNIKNTRNFYIENCNSLKISVLPNDMVMDGSITFYRNDSLTEVKGGNGITELSILEFYSNPNLSSINGLKNLKKLDVLSLRFLDKLEDLKWLSNLNSISNMFSMWDVKGIRTLNEFKNLKYVGKRIRIEDCSDLTDATILDQVAMDDWEVDIRWNKNLNNIPLKLMCKALEYNQYCTTMEISYIRYNGEIANKLIDSCR